MSAQEIVERIGIARIEGRLENVLEREKQLVALHQSVSKRLDDFVRLLQKDLSISKELATSELVTALDAINALYGRLNFHDELAKERQLKNGGRSATFFVGLGTTLILQLSSCPVTSTLCPLAATLAAGNPAVVLGSPALSATNELIEQVVSEALDREAFHFERSGDASNVNVYLQEQYATAVISSLEASQTLGPRIRAANPSVRLIEPYYGVPAGIVDRSGGHSVDAIVKQIRQSVLDGPAGNPLRIPRLFFVDESVIAAVRNQLHAPQEKTSSQLDEWLRKQYRGLTAQYPAKKDETQTISEFPQVENATIVKSASGSEIAFVPARSLDHTIDILNKINSGQGAQAIYVFAGGKEAFYLGNFINTSHIYINEIPNRALVSATGRSAGDTTAQAYRIEDFSETKTMLQIARPDPHKALDRPAILDAKKFKQPNGGRMSYFEQGLILGAAMGLVALTGLGFLSYRGYRAYKLR